MVPKGPKGPKMAPNGSKIMVMGGTKKGTRTHSFLSPNFQQLVLFSEACSYKTTYDITRRDITRRLTRQLQIESRLISKRAIDKSIISKA